MKKFLLLFTVFIFTQSVCYSLPNPTSWSEYVQKSQIKTVAVVTDIKKYKKTRGLVYKTVSFKSDNKAFIGTCATERKYLFGRYNPIVGGIYFNPKKGETVFVTVVKNGGEITTYQPLSPDDIKKFKKNPEKIKYNLGQAYIED